MEEIDLKGLFQMFWDKKTQIIIIIAIFAVLGLIYSLGFVTPKYESTTTLLLATNTTSDKVGVESSITTTDITVNSKLVSTYRDLVTSDKITRNVISNLALDIDGDDLKKSIKVTAKSDTEIIAVSVRNEDPALAAKIANEIAKVLIENVKGFYGIENLHVVDEAEVPQAPSNVHHVKDIVIFAFIGVIIAMIYVMILNMLDTTIKSEEEIEEITGLTILVTLPLYERTDDKRRKGGRMK